MFEQKIKIQKRETAPASQKATESLKESFHKEMADSLRAHFKKAIAVAALPIVFAVEPIGFSKKEVAQILDKQPTVISYLKKAHMISAESDISPDERAVLSRTVGRGTTLKRIFGESTMDELIGNTVPFKESAEHQKHPRMEGAAEDIDINTESIHETLDQLPRHWIEKIEKIIFRNEMNAMPSHYGINTWRSASVHRDESTKRMTIIFYKLPPRWRGKEEVKSNLIHEVTHPNDWGDRERSVAERVEMLYRVLARLSSADRFRSRYVESIRNDDKVQELVLKVDEYWAVIAAQYFVDKDVLPEQDRMLVEWYMAPPPKKYSKPHKEY